MKNVKKWISCFLALVFAIGMLPAEALAADDSFSLSAEEIARIRELSGYSTSEYHRGMSFSPTMTAYQMYGWLTDFRDETVAQIENQCAMFSAKIDAYPEYREMEVFNRVYELWEDADSIQQQMNYFIFDLNEQM